MEVTNHGETLISNPYSWNLGKIVDQVSIGFDHTLFLIQNENSIYAQGMGKQGELGLGLTTKGMINILFFSWNSHKNSLWIWFKHKVRKFLWCRRSIKAGVKRSFAITTDHKVYGWGKTDFAKKLLEPTHIPDLDPYYITSIKCGFKHTWFISRDKDDVIQSLVSSGNNKKLQLGNSSSSENIESRDTLLKELKNNELEIVDLQVCWNNTVLLCSEGGKAVLLISGDTKYGKIDTQVDTQPYGGELCSFYKKSLQFLEDQQVGVKKLMSMNESFFLLTTKNDLYGWGWNEHGNLSMDSTHDLSQPKFICKAAEVYGNGAYTILKTEVNDG